MPKTAAKVFASVKCAYCGYEWEPRVPNPKACPSCHMYRKNGKK